MGNGGYGVPLGSTIPIPALAEIGPSSTTSHCPSGSSQMDRTLGTIGAGWSEHAAMCSSRSIEE